MKYLAIILALTLNSCVYVEKCVEKRYYETKETPDES